MAALELNPDFAITDEQSLRGLFEPTHALALQKCQDRLGEHAQEFIRRSPFLCIGTQNLEGKADVSPRGDPPGFVKVLDARTLAIPDRPGNNRLDTLSNIIANPIVGLLFIVPRFRRHPAGERASDTEHRSRTTEADERCGSYPQTCHRLEGG